MRILDTFTTSAWSGGTNTQLYIHPEGASLKEQNFSFRLSTATIEQSPAIFTTLSSKIRRAFMLMEGQVTLQRERRDPVSLKPYEITHFNGADHITSIGQGIPFNLMTTEVLAVALEHQSLSTTQSLQLSPNNEKQMLPVYLHQGTADIFNPDGTLHQQQGQLLVSTGETVRLKATSPCEVVYVRVDL